MSSQNWYLLAIVILLIIAILYDYKKACECNNDAEKSECDLAYKTKMMSKEEFETFVNNTRGERFLKRTKTSMRICGENRLDLWLQSDFMRFLTKTTKERLN